MRPRYIRLILTSAAVLACARSDVPRADTAIMTDTAAALPAPAADTAEPQFSSAPWNDARRRGVDFRAIGQEPGWMLEIDHEGSIHLLADYGERKVTLPAVAPVRRDDGSLRYEASTPENRLTIVIREQPCADAMSGQRMTHEVTVTLDAREYRGCGRDLAAEAR